MKSDVIHVSSDGTGIQEALEKTEATGRYANLDQKETVRLRLLAEELMGMLQSITGRLSADYWVEAEGKDFQLHLKAIQLMTHEFRKTLLGVSTSGKNENAKGFMGRFRDMFSRMMEPEDDSIPTFYSGGWYDAEAASAGMSMAVMGAEMWSMNEYRETLANRAENEEAWDELEKSIVASLADEIKVGIGNNEVEMVIFKKF